MLKWVWNKIINQLLYNSQTTFFSCVCTEFRMKKVLCTAPLPKHLSIPQKYKIFTDQLCVLIRGTLKFWRRCHRQSAWKACFPSCLYQWRRAYGACDFNNGKFVTVTRITSQYFLKTSSRQCFSSFPSKSKVSLFPKLLLLLVPLLLNKHSDDGPWADGRAKVAWQTNARYFDTANRRWGRSRRCYSFKKSDRKKITTRVKLG